MFHQIIIGVDLIGTEAESLEINMIHKRKYILLVLAITKRDPERLFLRNGN
jgi:hypothetical protein